MSTKAQINAAMKLLKKEGYTVNKKRPDPRIGDVVRMEGDRGELIDLLITFRQIDSATLEDVYEYGGIVVSEQTYMDQYTDSMWIDRNEWAKDDGQYEVVGHVDLTKWIKR
jgi:hypothetical protein